MWELANIAESVEARRLAVYQDIDRTDGPMWTQVFGICMDAVKSIETRIDDFTKPPAPAAPPPAAAKPEERKRISAPLREDTVLTGVKESALRKELKNYVKGVTTSPGSPPTKIRPWVEKTLQDAQSRLKREQSSGVTKATGPIQKLILAGVQYPIGAAIFLQSFRTRFAGIVLGSPYAEPTIYSHAITALCKLAAHSLAEDQFGNVHRDVPKIVRTLTSIIKKVQSLKEAFPLHWTDTSELKSCPEVEMVLDAARTGLLEVVDKFEPYHKDLRLTLTDLRLAKEAAAKPKAITKGNEVEMEEAKK